MRSIVILALALILGASAYATAPDARVKREAREAALLQERLAELTPGKALHCIESRRASGPESFGESTLLFRVSRNLTYRTEVRGNCEGVGHGKALVIKSWGSRICKGDLAHTTSFTGGGGWVEGSCSMGDFIPWKRTQK